MIEIKWRDRNQDMQVLSRPYFETEFLDALLFAQKDYLYSTKDKQVASNYVWNDALQGLHIILICRICYV